MWPSVWASLTVRVKTDLWWCLCTNDKTCFFKNWNLRELDHILYMKWFSHSPPPYWSAWFPRACNASRCKNIRGEGQGLDRLESPSHNKPEGVGEEQRSAWFLVSLFNENCFSLHLFISRVCQWNLFFLCVYSDNTCNWHILTPPFLVFLWFIYFIFFLLVVSIIRALYCLWQYEKNCWLTYILT